MVAVGKRDLLFTVGFAYIIATKLQPYIGPEK